MLAILINRAEGEGHINGVVLHLVDDGLSILQYTDDTIIFLEHDTIMLAILINFCVLLSSSRDSKLTFIKVKYFILDMQRRCKRVFQYFWMSMWYISI
jgi:hypothetical protein